MFKEEQKDLAGLIDEIDALNMETMGYLRKISIRDVKIRKEIHVQRVQTRKQEGEEAQDENELDRAANY